ncbi:hypothetical protein DZC72_13195 [Maribacter algicola]|uniref:Lipoprotein n=1 Tax=Maribacter algicola TaxID=2498892 RepID=A0A3R8R2D3_9FLAO|nr:hypothetical protein [Maribacter algicola]RRQ48637.1 hypothetical protein DZC72_13195 [Maribacter algicola]
MKTSLILCSCALLALSSCSTTKTIKFSEKQNDVYTTENLKEFLKKNKNPKVVLRVPEVSINTTTQENIDYLYNSIENQLLSSGFVVRDRQLFNQIIENESNNVDYEKLKEKSDTDLIIELTKLDPSILYETNQFYDKKNRVRTEKEGIHERYGASVEFKVVSIENNEYAGMYKLNYTPCTYGCIVSQSFKDLRKELKDKKKKEAEPYEGVEKDVLEEFIKDATIKLVNEMRY